MITLTIRFLAPTDNRDARWKITDYKQSKIIPVMTRGHNRDYKEAALIFLDEHYPDCQFIGFGELPINNDYVALAAFK